MHFLAGLFCNVVGVSVLTFFIPPHSPFFNIFYGEEWRGNGEEWRGKRSPKVVFAA